MYLIIKVKSCLIKNLVAPRVSYTNIIRPLKYNTFTNCIDICIRYHLQYNYMSKNLTDSDIDQSIAPKLYSQAYKEKVRIEGVQFISLKNHVGEDGDLSEVLKITQTGEVEGITDFKIAQINSTKLSPGTIKGWHLHFKQNDLWYVMPSSHLLVCVWDVRKFSNTKGAVMRFAMGGGNSQLLFIPKGVAHGAANVSQKDTHILYFVDQKFDINDPDEKRIPWDSLGADFWRPLRD